mgnify:FL=1
MNSQVAKSIVPADVSYDEKKLELHKLDSLTLLLYTFLLTLTVVTIWLFKHRYELLTQLRTERHPSVHKWFLNMWCEQNFNGQLMLQASISPVVTNLLTPHLFLLVLMIVSHI